MFIKSVDNKLYKRHLFTLQKKDTHTHTYTILYTRHTHLNISISFLRFLSISRPYASLLTTGQFSLLKCHKFGTQSVHLFLSEFDFGFTDDWYDFNFYVSGITTDGQLEIHRRQTEEIISCYIKSNRIIFKCSCYYIMVDYLVIHNHRCIPSNPYTPSLKFLYKKFAMILI